MKMTGDAAEDEYERGKKREPAKQSKVKQKNHALLSFYRRIFLTSHMPPFLAAFTLGQHTHPKPPSRLSTEPNRQVEKSHEPSQAHSVRTSGYESASQNHPNPRASQTRGQTDRPIGRPASGRDDGLTYSSVGSLRPLLRAMALTDGGGGGGGGGADGWVA